LTDKQRAKIDQLHPLMRARVLKVFEEVGRSTFKHLMPVESVRSFERQAELYAKGRRLTPAGVWIVVEPGLVVTNAMPGLSYHAYGLALDCAWGGPDPYLDKVPPAIAREAWNVYGRAVRNNGLVWGGDWNGNGISDPKDFDRPHCEMSFGLNPRELLHLYSQGGIPAVWAAIDRANGGPKA
jgi:peptidoglycan L-alanyl-D-glutamate endopeptidase CwlK